MVFVFRCTHKKSQTHDSFRGHRIGNGDNLPGIFPGHKLVMAKFLGSDTHPYLLSRPLCDYCGDNAADKNHDYRSVHDIFCKQTILKTDHGGGNGCRCLSRCQTEHQSAVGTVESEES